MTNLIEYPDRDLLMLGLADKLAGALRRDLNIKQRVSFSVPGGTTPGPVFDMLSAVDLAWDRIDVILNDERWVPEASERSNTALLRRRLLVDKAAAGTLVPLRSDAETPEEGLEALIGAVSECLPLDILLVGMGTDMHTASLFPGADQLDAALAANAPALMAMRAPGVPEPRITLTAPVLRAAVETHILITGAEKLEALRKAEKLRDARDAPIRVVLNTATVHWAP